MTTRQIEIWALNVLRRVEAKQPHEYTRVELKIAFAHTAVFAGVIGTLSNQQSHRR